MKFKFGGHEKELKAKRMGRGMGSYCKGKGSGGKHNFVNGECTHCGCEE